VTNFANWFTPFPIWYAIGPNIRYFARHGARGVFAEASYPTAGGDFEELKDYMLGRLLTDPTLDDEQLITEFLLGYFGPAAAPHVRRYMDTMHDAFTATRRGPFFEDASGKSVFASSIDGYHNHSGVLWENHSALLHAAAAFSAARASVARVPARTAGFFKRVAKAQLPIYFVILLRWNATMAYAKQAGVPWPLQRCPSNDGGPCTTADTVDLAFAEFEQVFDLFKLEKMNEGSESSLACFKRQVFQTPPCVPAKQWPKAQWWKNGGTFPVCCPQLIG
jgi:hypothetical protein